MKFLGYTLAVIGLLIAGSTGKARTWKQNGFWKSLLIFIAGVIIGAIGVALIKL